MAEDPSAEPRSPGIFAEVGMVRDVHTLAHMFRGLFVSMALIVIAGCSAGAVDEESEAPAEEATADALSSPSAVLDEARADGLVGETARGYLAAAPGVAPSRDLKATIGDINIKRRAIYTDLAVRRSVTVETVAHAFACELFATRVPIGQRYEDQSGTWRTHTAAEPMAMPSFCPSGD
jgi:uncharacterized protein YdbL (DUF1318 family)